VKRAVLLIGHGHGPSIAYWPLAKKLSDSYGIDVGGMYLQDLTQLDQLFPFHAVIVTGLSRLVAGNGLCNDLSITGDRLTPLLAILSQYANMGGGLYIYGRSYVTMGDSSSTSTLNLLLQALGGAAILFEMIEQEDSLLEHQQTGGMKLRYAEAASILAHPATQGATSLLYPIGCQWYGPWTRPLQLDGTWTPLLATSASAVCVPVVGDFCVTAGPSQASVPAAIYAVKPYGSKGRVVLNGSESIISFFNYHYSPYADEQWGTVGMDNGLDGVPSHGLQLLVSSLQWLTDPSFLDPQIGLGGFVPPPPPQPETVGPYPLWVPPTEPLPKLQYLKGVIGAVPAAGGGAGSVEEFVNAAKAQGLDFLVLAGEAAKMTQQAWDQLKDECAAQSTQGFRAIPGLLTRDAWCNRFLTTGFPPLPAGPVIDHLDFWFKAQNAFRAPYWLSSGTYPAWLYGAYTAFPIRTYEDNVLREDQTDAYLQNVSQGDGCTLFVMTLVTHPSLLAGVPEHTYIKANHIDCFVHEVLFTADSFVSGASEGPRFDCFYSTNSSRYTAGKLYHAGSERWRVYLRVSAGAGLASASLFDHGDLLRRFALSGSEAELNIDLLHDRSHVLTCVVEDAAGGKATAGLVSSSQDLMRDFWLGDRCNMAGGQMATFREDQGPLVRVSATCALFKGGRLQFGAPASGDQVLPGIDGSGIHSQFQQAVHLRPTLTDQLTAATAPVGIPVHRVYRLYESADAIITHTPILKRTVASDPIAHNPTVALWQPAYEAALRQCYFYRRPASPATVVADLAMIPDSTTLTPDAWGFTQYYTHRGLANVFHEFVVVRKNGTKIKGSPDGNSMVWQGMLDAGDFVLFPEIREGFFVLSGSLAARLVGTLDPAGSEVFYYWTGKVDANVKPVRLLGLRTIEGLTEDEIVADWIKYRDGYGLAGQPAAYQLTVSQGAVVPTPARYPLAVKAINGGFQAKVSGGQLPLRLPVEVRDLNPRWTAGKVDLAKNEWFPLYVRDSTAYTTINPRERNHFYIGNLVTANHPGVFVTLLPHNDDGTVKVEVHNPTKSKLVVQVTVPISTFLAAAQTVSLTVAKGHSFRVTLKKP